METALSRNVRILPDAEAVAHTAARIFSSAAAVAISQRGRFSAVLSGGKTPQQLYRMLADAYREHIRWDLTHLFWSDERCVPADHEQSNFRLAREELISRISIPAGNIHRVKGELAPEEAAKKYEHDLRTHFGPEGIPAFDLILLGLGSDGHAASLFPGAETLSETERLAVPAFSASAGNWRVTLTLPVLNSSPLVVFLVTGKTKAEIVTEILAKGKRDPYPAGAISPQHGRIVWLLDSDAASGMQQKPS
jgi:6-phosphogluconolactonase